MFLPDQDAVFGETAAIGCFDSSSGFFQLRTNPGCKVCSSSGSKEFSQSKHEVDLGSMHSVQTEIEDEVNKYKHRVI